MGFFSNILEIAAPRAALVREEQRVRLARARQVRNVYEGAAAGRRTQHWRVGGLDSNAENAPAIHRIRDIARDLIRNNAYARKAKTVIVNNVVGAGIVPRITARSKGIQARVKEHFETTAIDSRGRRNLYGLEALVQGMVAESGECVVRYRQRRPEDGLPLPFQLQILEGDYIDTGKNGAVPNGNMVNQGVEIDALGRIAAYWLFPSHPGGSTRLAMGSTSQRVEARFVAHIFRDDRDAEMVRGMSWFTPVILRMRDFADYTDAQLIRQKMATCFTAFVTSDSGVDGEGITDDPDETYPLEAFEPGMIERLRPGESVEFPNPPNTGDFDPYTRVTLREIAAGLGITYESLTGDLGGVNFSSGRMGWIEFQRNVDAWRWQMLIPQFLDRLTGWTNDALAVEDKPPVAIAWTPPKREMIQPKEELQASKDAIRAGLSSWSEEVRSFGFDPDELAEEMAADNKRFDDKDLVLDSDPRKTTAAGNAVLPAAPAAPDPAPAADAAKALSLEVERGFRAVANRIDIMEARAAVKPDPVPAPPMSIVLDEKHITVDAVRPSVMTPETHDEKGRLLTALIRPASGKGAVMRRTFMWKPDKRGTLRGAGFTDEIIPEMEDNG